MSVAEKFITQRHREELREKGFTIVETVLSAAECEEHKANYRKWLSGFPEGSWPHTEHSLIQKYGVGHMDSSWRIRLKALPAFTELWKTEKLLSSFDAISVGRPPEGGEEDFWAADQSWLHVDQSAYRIGLHAYQGAVYLEDCEEDDWTFEVVEGSHKHYAELHDRVQKIRCTKLTPDDFEWLQQKGCRPVRVPCPKGGMVLWDSRLLHANARPKHGRANPGRWRWVVFVCMTPAAWAKQSDLLQKKRAYENLDLTCHWPSRGVWVFSSKISEGMVEDPNPMTEHPDIAKTDVVKRLVGLIPYDDDEEKKDGDESGCVHTLEFDPEKFKGQMTQNDKLSFVEYLDESELPAPYEPFSKFEK